MAYTRKEFIDKIAPMAIDNAKISQILPSLTIAQALLESDSGNSTLTTQANALFGIKATSSWRGKVWNGKTTEYYDGQKTMITAGFKAYDSWAESILDHSKLLTSNKRYSKVVGETNYKNACEAIAAAGYATDPQYANKLISLIESYNLNQYDVLKPSAATGELSASVSKMIKAGVVIDFNSWKREDLIKLENVPLLMCKLAGVEINKNNVEAQYQIAVTLLVTRGIIQNEKLWKGKQYTVNNVKDLLIKYASAIKE